MVIGSWKCKARGKEARREKTRRGKEEASRKGKTLIPWGEGEVRFTEFPHWGKNTLGSKENQRKRAQDSFEAPDE